MNTNDKRVIDFPDGVLFAGPDDDPYLRKPRKQIDFREALSYALKAKEEGREVTFSEMQRFVH